MADYSDGGLGGQVNIVCEHYLGPPERRESAGETTEERAVWVCPECRGDWVAHRGRAGCADPGCPAPRNVDAFGIVAHFEGLDQRKNLQNLIQKVRRLVRAEAEKRSRERAEAEKRAKNKARAAREDSEGKEMDESHSPGTRRNGSSAGPQKGSPHRALELQPEELAAFEAYREEQKRKEQDQLREHERERHETELRESTERHRGLIERTVDAHGWASPRELAEAVCVMLCAAACVWMAVTVAEAAYDLIAEAFGATGIPDYEVGHLEVGRLGEYAPVGAEPWPHTTTFRERIEEDWREHHRLLIAFMLGTVAGVAQGWRRAAKRRAANAFSAGECLELRITGKEEQ